jgi:hypothetical protein
MAAGQAMDAAADQPAFFNLLETLYMMDTLTREEVNALGGTAPLEIDHYIEHHALEFKASKYVAGPPTIGFDRFDSPEAIELYENYFKALMNSNNPILTIISYRLFNVYTGDLDKMADTKNPMLVAWLYLEWATASDGEFLDWLTAYHTTDALDYTLLRDDFLLDKGLARYKAFITEREKNLGDKVINPELWVGLQYRICMANNLEPSDYFTAEEIEIGKRYAGSFCDENDYSDLEDDDNDGNDGADADAAAGGVGGGPEDSVPAMEEEE